ncbi:MAG: META domain-containing protein [Lutimonas sp.]
MKTLPTLFLLIILTSCGSSQQTYIEPHTQEHLNVHENFAANQQKEIADKEFAFKVKGIYEGLVPCGDCSGIETKVQLYPDMMYRTEMTYKGKSDAPIVRSGKYSVANNGVILLGEEPTGYNQFIFVTDHLILLNKNGQMIEGNLAEKYYLYPPNQRPVMKHEEGTPNFLIEKYQRGIDFYAQGNEPFWNLEMDFEKIISFNTLNGLKFNSPPVKADKAMDANIIRYRAVTESGEIIIQLYKSKCDDTMADKSYGYAVNIDFKTSKETNYTSYKGCGDYIPDMRLHNIWAIETVGETTLNRADFSQKYPTIEINTSEGRANGNDGCNNLMGKVSFEPGKIEFGPMASTMMACHENEEISRKIVQTLNGVLDYTLENNRLVLSKNGENVMTLRHVD